MSRCRALLVSAPASGQGKTTVTAALARLARQRGLRTRVFKTGPDFIDPTILERASGLPAYQLDLWMVGADECRRRLAASARDADLILVEGVMGLFDGDPSSADLAERFGLPVLAVIDGSAMAQTFGAMAQGLAGYRDTLRLHGVIANRVGGALHVRMLRDSVRAPLRFLGALPRDPAIQLPERHLGLVLATELDDLDARVDAAAKALAASADLDLDGLPVVEFDETPADAEPTARLLEGVRIAVARDDAHAFLYPANLDTLGALGAALDFFSPLNDTTLPDCDAVWLPGGYPELHARRLADNARMQFALRAHHAAGRPMLAECGGMMGLFDTLTDRDGCVHRMAGLLPGSTTMQPRLQALGLQAVQTPEGPLRGHSFHHSRSDTALQPWRRASDPNGGNTAEPVYRQGRLTASYVHFYFASNPAATAALFRP